MDDRGMSVGAIAAYLGVSKDSICSWACARNMPGHKVARFWNFKSDEVGVSIRAERASVEARSVQEAS